jgi:hypothetical protein
MLEWIKKKVGLSSNLLKLTTKEDLERKTRTVDNLVVFFAHTLKINKFATYQELAKDFI